MTKPVRKPVNVLVAALLASAAVAGYLTVASRETVVAEQHVTYRPIQVEADGYVSSQTCRSCHPSQYDAWYDSYHRTMTQVATEDTVRADFDGVRTPDVPGGSMRLERRGGQFWAEFDDPDLTRQAGPPSRITRQIVMVTGSHQQQVYWYRTDRSRLLGQLPAMYLIAERQWIPRLAAFLAPHIDHTASETGRWNVVCIKCHATHGKPELETLLSAPLTAPAVDTTVAEFGIACEACHGPAAAHARVNRNPLRRYGLHLSGERDSTVTQPVHLSPKRSSQVCGQCHGIWEYFDQQAERKASVSGSPYRPGDDLADTRFVVQPTTNLAAPTMQRLLEQDPDVLKRSFWADGMVRVSGREYNGLIDSPCFKDARDEKRMMSCFSCHTMHKTPEDPRAVGEWARTHQVSAGMNSNQACVQCHAAFQTNLSAHTKHRANSVGSDCYNCHMPYTSYGLLRALRSHQISSPNVAASLQTGRPNACNLCHLDQTLAWTSGYLEKWYGAPRVELTDDEQTIAASVLWLLRGDAGQRALVAWSMGWQPAQQTSGVGWMGPYLAELLEDPYDAVRLISSRSLRTLPGFADFDYDFVAPPRQQFADAVKALTLWRRAPRVNERTAPALLISSDGNLNMDVVRRLLRQRDARPVLLRE